MSFSKDLIADKAFHLEIHEKNRCESSLMSQPRIPSVQYKIKCKT